MNLASDAERDTAKVMGTWTKEGVKLDSFPINLPPLCSVVITVSVAGVRQQTVGTIGIFTIFLEYICLKCKFHAFSKKDFVAHTCPGVAA